MLQCRRRCDFRARYCTELCSAAQAEVDMVAEPMVIPVSTSNAPMRASRLKEIGDAIEVIAGDDHQEDSALVVV